MLNTVNIFSFLMFDFLLLFVTRDFTLLLYVPSLKHYSASTWMQQCERTNKHPFEAGGEIP